MSRNTGASHPKGNRPAAVGQVQGRFAPEKTGLRPMDMFTGASRPKLGRYTGAVRKLACGFAPERKPACGRWAGTRVLRARKQTGLRSVARYTDASGKKPACGRWAGTRRFAPKSKSACGRWACIRWGGTWALRAQKETGLRPVGRYTGASGKKPAYGRWACIWALRARKETGQQPVGMFTGASRLERNRPAAGRQVHGRFAPERKPAYGR